MKNKQYKVVLLSLYVDMGGPCVNTCVLSPIGLNIKELVNQFIDDNKKLFVDYETRSSLYLPLKPNISNDDVINKLKKVLILNGCEAIKYDEIELGD